MTATPTPPITANATPDPPDPICVHKNCRQPRSAHIRAYGLKCPTTAFYQRFKGPRDAET